jgi:hypothetical protein
MTEDYLVGAESNIDSSFVEIRKSGNFRSIFKISLAFDAVLSRISGHNVHPPLTSLRTIVKRIPLLVSICQLSVAATELRQLSELVLWCVFFTDHPVEWSNFEKNPTRGYIKDLDNPISYLANREPTFYANYARERFASEPSGLAIDAVKKLNYDRTQLSAFVHPGRIAVGRSTLPPFEDISEGFLGNFQKIQRSVMSHGCIILTAQRRKVFDKLPPVHRAWFDWLVGKALSKRVRTQSFGLNS